MFYEPRKRNHGLPHDPFIAIVAPRPIGWITSMSANGEINLAPYSFFNAVAANPPIVMFSSTGIKDSITFVEETKEFVCNLATWALRYEMNETSRSYPRGVDENLAQFRLAQWRHIDLVMRPEERRVVLQMAEVAAGYRARRDADIMR